MRVGTKSVLFGAHCFGIHFLFIALAWWKLYGFPWDPRLWLAFYLHDVGYLQKPYMDRAAERQAGGDKFTAEESVLLGSHNPNLWLQGLKSYTRRWVEQHRDGRRDTWTQTEKPSTSLSW